MTIVLLILAIIFNATANILMKLGAGRIKTFALNVAGIKEFILNPFVVTGIISFGITLILYTYVLSKMNLSIAYPLMTATGFLIVTTFSVFYLKEVVLMPQIIGMVLVVGGLWLIAR
ncbi:MAG: hypothetical protein A2V81_00705 [Candidatus Abawacabacteria bacterium RBG_16_42_10]|uniref:EamA domain-containing protein n=1 Tax=Candidatus Abawacabacteria bacterium RBG_16_42_10 TaxID=1817814 RepID=A0A1F4XLC3_9BACT|nr:MAG: hypothetical protein A2V81_00705 [Candidatus Abawacabacteria bacterium RBG_16_42_10]